MAEGGGERKRKAPLSLDWEKLLPAGNNDEEEPPTIQVIPDAETPKPWSAVMDDGEDSSFKDDNFRKLSAKELNDAVSRMKRCIIPMGGRLPDGGAKLRARLTSLEAEVERRKLQKDNDKCEKAASSVDELTCTGGADGMSPETSSSVPASQSKFALHLCSKLDNETGHISAKPFDEEISTLNHRDNKIVRANGQFSSKKRQKKGLPSRQTPFESPKHLSVKIDIQTQSNGEKLGRHSSTPEEDTFCSSAKKADAPRCPPSHFSRCNSHKTTVVLVDEEEPEVDVTDQADKLDQSTKETRIYYPSRDDPEAVEICYSDMQCLTPQSYLSSTIMNFYIRYLQKPTSSTATERCDYHFFNTYFYKKLKRDVLNKIDKETSFGKFRRWWKGVNLFEKAYIFLPIHEAICIMAGACCDSCSLVHPAHWLYHNLHHWSLVIICIPDKEDASGPIILHLDSLGMHPSNTIFNDVKSFLIEEWKFLRQGEVLPELPIADKIWEKLSRRIDEKVIEVPQQRNEYDCGLFVLFFMERFIDEAPDRLKKKDLAMFGKQWFQPQEASSLRQNIRNLLNEEFKNANEAKCKLDP